MFFAFDIEMFKTLLIYSFAFVSKLWLIKNFKHLVGREYV